MSDRLDGWKAIAAFVRRSVRTAQRWEQDLGLPVHRIQMDGGEIVYAKPAEIEAWLRARERPSASTAPRPPGAVADAAMATETLAMPGMSLGSGAADIYLPLWRMVGLLTAGALLGFALGRLY